MITDAARCVYEMNGGRENKEAGKMTPQEFTEAMRQIYSGKRTPDITHSDADDLMMKVLTELGYGEGVEIFAAATRWYD